MKWKRKGGRDRAQAAGCQFVIAHVEDAWIARYCDRSGRWSEPVSRESKALVMQWCDGMAEIEVELQGVEVSELATRRAVAASFENRDPDEKKVIRIFRTWKQAPKEVRDTMSKQHGGLRESMEIFEKFEKDQGVSL